MSAPKFTPGPLVAEHSLDEWQVRTEDGLFVASVVTLQQYVPREERLAINRANAVLFAAAPELYAALERVIPEIEIGGWSATAVASWLSDAKAALAKARGEG